MISGIFQDIATGGAVLLGITYVIGGLIVNLNLARRGVVEFQILKVKYFVTGLVFIFQSIGIIILSLIIGVVVAVTEVPTAWLQAINIVSMSMALSLFVAWARLTPISKSVFASWRYWLFASTIGLTFPATIAVRQLLSQSPPNIFELVFIIQGMLTGVISVLGQVYHYSVFYYGLSSGLGGLDPIGVGIPSRVRISATKENAALIKSLGVTFHKSNVTEDLYLIDETDHYYILAFEAVPDKKKDAGTLKIDKSLVKAILYLPDLKLP